MLTEIHRQAEDNPIIRLSQIVRSGGELADGAYGESRVIRRAAIDAAQVLAADQVLVGINRTRRAYNQRIRAAHRLRRTAAARGRPAGLPEERPDQGPDQRRPVAGRGARRGGEGLCPLDRALRGRWRPRNRSRSRCCKAFFEGTEGELAYPLRRESDEFDYGYALTVHKAQGSQWDDVLLFDESYAFREHRARWLYTGLTRAAKRLTIVR